VASGSLPCRFLPRVSCHNTVSDCHVCYVALQDEELTRDHKIDFDLMKKGDDVRQLVYKEVLRYNSDPATRTCQVPYTGIGVSSSKEDDGDDVLLATRDEAGGAAATGGAGAGAGAGAVPAAGSVAAAPEPPVATASGSSSATSLTEKFSEAGMDTPSE